MQHPVYLFNTQGKILKIAILDFWNNKNEVDTPRMHSCGNIIHNEVSNFWMINAIFKQRVYLEARWLSCNTFYILCASSDQQIANILHNVKYLNLLAQTQRTSRPLVAQIVQKIKII
jgi:hypothetical protein